MFVWIRAESTAVYTSGFHRQPWQHPHHVSKIMRHSLDHELFLLPLFWHNIISVWTVQRIISRTVLVLLEKPDLGATNGLYFAVNPLYSQSLGNLLKWLFRFIVLNLMTSSLTSSESDIPASKPNYNYFWSSENGLLCIKLATNKQ